MKGKNLWIDLLLVALVLALVVIPLAFFRNAEFAGADSEATDLIGQVAPDYEPWFESIWTPPSGEVESFLFALQAALGAGVICYGVGYWRGKSSREKEV